MEDAIEGIRNKVAESGIQVFNLEELIPQTPVIEFDLAPFLAGGFVLREKEFRTALKEYDWSPFSGAQVGVFCSTDAIIPTWAFMLVASKLDGIAAGVTSSRARNIKENLLLEAIDAHDYSDYQDQIVVIKGCGTASISPSAYVEATAAMQKVAKKIMYGEPCSSVPIWRRKQ